MSSLLVDSRMLSYLPNLFNSLCTIEAETPTQDSDSGQEVLTYANETRRLKNIPCYIEPKPAGTEVRRPDQTIAKDVFTIALKGYFPTIDIEDHAVTDNDDVHNILNVNHDDTHTITLLDTEIIHG